MYKLTNNIYSHRRVIIIKWTQGITAELPGIDLNLYKTYEDARQAIDEYLDHTNTKEPRIIGTYVSSHAQEQKGR